MTRETHSLTIVLRCFGILDLCALFAVAMPREWMEPLAAWAGPGLPSGALPAYLARTASALFALHGATVLFVSFDVERYWRLIRFLAILALVHGAIVLTVDVAEGMPWWWCLIEGPGIAMTGVIVLLIQWQAADKGSGSP